MVNGRKRQISKYLTHLSRCWPSTHEKVVSQEELHDSEMHLSDPRFLLKLAVQVLLAGLQTRRTVHRYIMNEVGKKKMGN